MHEIGHQGKVVCGIYDIIYFDIYFDIIFTWSFNEITMYWHIVIEISNVCQTESVWKVGEIYLDETRIKGSHSGLGFFLFL